MILVWELLTLRSFVAPMVDAKCSAAVGSARIGRLLDAGSAREDRFSDVCYVGVTR